MTNCKNAHSGLEWINMSEEQTPRPIRVGITTEKIPEQVSSMLDKYAQTLVDITQSIIANAALGDGTKVMEGIEKAIRDSGIPPAQQAMAREGFTLFTNAFIGPERPQIIQKPHLRVLRREENK